MDLETLLRVAGAGIPVGGVVLAMAWLFFRPKVNSMIEKKVEDCQEHQGKIITEGFAAISKEIKGVSDDTKYLRGRLDTHIDDGH